MLLLLSATSKKVSVGNVMKAGLRKYKEMITNTELDTEQKVLPSKKKLKKLQHLNCQCWKKTWYFFQLSLRLQPCWVC